MNYTIEQLQEAFTKVQNKQDWKARIRYIVSAGESHDLIQAAIIYFTATVPMFYPFDIKKGTYLVEADGYRYGPAGDH